jgi:hypothetical protein
MSRNQSSIRFLPKYVSRTFCAAKILATTGSTYLFRFARRMSSAP